MTTCAWSGADCCAAGEPSSGRRGASKATMSPRRSDAPGWSTLKTSASPASPAQGPSATRTLEN
eukprot:6404575-Alexandrium_andersonii.AAC.1